MLLEEFLLNAELMGAYQRKEPNCLNGLSIICGMFSY